MPATMRAMPYDPKRAAFRERLGMYLLGLAIGCAILGVIFTMRRQAAPPSPPALPTGPQGR